ncbi:uncharacterized protein LOC114331182 [Diabrotica virgifera virgifera]|uniref:Uncharacterized protein n=1 Tax=Diabrotica virgifera virgifera TaxID=50390 RepID=A0ABM5KE10_DIAVI|nr:uncharacterized protein LOC114331182 [Diabrotica virgifera virgifera]
MKLYLLIFAVICISNVQSDHPVKPVEITEENFAALVDALKKLLELYKNPEHIHKQVVEKVHELKDALSITTNERSLIPDLQKLLATIYYGLGGVIKLLLPPNRDLFDIAADVAATIASHLVHDNKQLLDLLEKVIIAVSSIARVAVTSALDIIIPPIPYITPLDRA